MRTFQRSVGWLAVVALVVACNGDDDGGDDGGDTSAVPSTSTSTSPSTTSGPTVPTTPPPSSAEPSTTADAVTSSSTSAPPTDEELVVAAYEAAYDAFWAAAQDPDDPELRRRLEQTHSGTSLEFVIGQLDEFVIAGERLVPSTATPDGYEIESVTVNGDEATVVSCVVNPWIWVRTDGPEPTDTAVLDDDAANANPPVGGAFVAVSFSRHVDLVVEDFSEEQQCGS